MRYLIVLTCLATALCFVTSAGVAKEATPEAVAPVISAANTETFSVVSTSAAFQAGVDSGGAVGTLHVDCLDQDVFCGARCEIACWGSACVCYCLYTGNPQDVCLFSQCSFSVC